MTHMAGLRKGGTIEQVCGMVEDLMRGCEYDRHYLAASYGITVASADRYLRALVRIPGVVARKKGRRLSVAFFFGDALKAVGR